MNKNCQIILSEKTEKGETEETENLLARIPETFTPLENNFPHEETSGQTLKGEFKYRSETNSNTLNPKSCFMQDSPINPISIS